MTTPATLEQTDSFKFSIVDENFFLIDKS